ncbi:MAG: sortase [Christensenellaceae bacterium]|nr:sortase [Christensenellaceae bacterium]
MVKRIISIPLIMLGLLLSVAALGLTAYNLWDNHRAGIEAEAVLDAITQHREKVENTESAAAPTPELPPDLNSGSENNPVKELPVVEIGGNRYIGTISVPVIGLELPVLEDWSLALLKIAPCRYMGSPYRGDLIICAHNYASHFGHLKNLEPGDEVVFTDVEGNAFHYTVAELDTLAGTAVEEMESGEWDMTLFTCTLGGETRVTVRCDLLESSEE